MKTTNKRSEHVESQFGNVPLAPVLVNSARVGFILTPFWFSYSFLQFSEPLPEALLNLLPEAGCQAVKAFHTESRGSACKGLGVRFLREVYPFQEERTRDTMCALNS